MAHQVQGRWQERQRRNHAGGRADGHDATEAGDALVLGQHETSKTNDGCQGRHENRFAGAFCENARLLFLGITIQDMNAAGHADPNHQREGHNIGRIELNVEPTHVSNHPDGADSDGH